MQLNNSFNLDTRQRVVNEISSTFLSRLNCVSKIFFYKALIAFALYAFLATPYVRNILEQFMLSHMLVQLPLLAILGGWMANEILKIITIKIPYHISLPLLILALTTAIYWMLPRVLDASIEYTGYEVLKFITLPLFLGTPLVLGLRNVGPITKSFFFANLLSMLVVLAWVYIEAPIRLCNYYLINEQKLLGEALVYITIVFALVWIAKLFIGSKPKELG